MRVLLTIQTMSAMCLFIIVGSLLLSMVLDFADDEPIEEVGTNSSQTHTGEWPSPAYIGDKNSSVSIKQEKEQEKRASSISSQTESQPNSASNSKEKIDINTSKASALANLDSDSQTYQDVSNLPDENLSDPKTESNHYGPTAIIKSSINNLAEGIMQENERIKTNFDRLHFLVKTNVLPITDRELFAKLALGKNAWNYIDDDQRSDVIDYFEDKFSKGFSKVFANYNGEKITFSPPKFNKKKSKSMVRSEFIGRHGEPIEMHFYMFKKNNSWMVYNVNVGGVDFIKSYRSHYSRVENEHGVEKLIKLLIDKDNINRL